MRGRAGELRPIVCANLPYSVTTPLLAAFIEAGCFERMTVMIQREVAERLAASPGTKDYGAFTVFVGWHCEVKKLFDVPPECFMPRPKVTSSVVALTPRPAPPAACADEKLMFRCVRAAFSQRRKTLSNALTNGLGGYAREEVNAAPSRRGHRPAGARGDPLRAGFRPARLRARRRGGHNDGNAAPTAEIFGYLAPQKRADFT